MPLVAQIGRTVAPALSVEMLRVAAEVPVLRIDSQGGEQVSLVIGDLPVPMQSSGAFNVYFSRHDPERFVSAETVLSGRVDAELLRGKLVLVGITGLGLLDFQATPLGERIPGVEVHAQMLEQMFDGVFLRRPTAASWLEALLLAAAGLVFILFVPPARPWMRVLLFVSVLAALAAAGLLAFRAGWLVNVAIPALGALILMGALLAATLAEADRQQRMLREAQARVAGEIEAARRIQMGLFQNRSPSTTT